ALVQVFNFKTLECLKNSQLLFLSKSLDYFL
ncbi:unnamed protein product, partial [marine sediment metagenome]